MVKEEKTKAVENLRKDLEQSPVIALADMHKMPSKQLQEIRKVLRGKAEIEMIKKTILKFALEGAKKENIKEMEPHIPKQPAIILTDIGAFKFYNIVGNLRFKTFAKEGDIPDEDIWVSAGPTHLMAGPVISELQQAGVPASIESGRITIRKDKCVVKGGEEVSAVVANVLRKLKIEPMEVTLKIVAIYDNGNLYTKDSLELTKVFPQMLTVGFNKALNLSIFVAFPTKENIRHLIAKAVRSANAIKGLFKPLEPAGPVIEPPAKVSEKGDDISDNIRQEPKENHGGAS